MPDLLAQGPRPQDRWRRALPALGAQMILGRTAEPWAVTWDDRVSREHATIEWNGQQLSVAKLPRARNAIFFRGKQRDEFSASVGEHFVIGQTTFTVVDHDEELSRTRPQAFAEQTFSAHILRQSKYKDGGRRIEALGKLPEIIAGASNDKDLCANIVKLMLQAVLQASFVAIVQLTIRDEEAVQETATATEGTATEVTANEGTATEGTATGATASESDSREQNSSAPNAGGKIKALVWRTPISESEIELLVLHSDCRRSSGPPVSPSVQLIRTAVTRQESVLHVWSRTATVNLTFTQSEDIDWAFCTPVVSDACRGWGIYVAGNFAGMQFASDATGSAGAEALQDDLKFTELMATTMGALRQVRALQRRQDSLQNFFAPVVLDAMAKHDPDEVLAPREANVTVMFCDLRGFTKRSEESADRLLELLQRVSDALGVMTHNILANGGVVGDFHGDAAMGFWGWPIAESHSTQAACQAALAISHEFARASAQPSHPLADFRAGIGIASGRAVAGRIGTTDQVKVTVFGPVVNLASRLEGMTKQLQAAILIDEATATWVRTNVPSDILRVRRVARVLPYGMRIPLTVCELLPPVQAYPVMTDQHLNAYEEALDFFIAGEWSDAFQLLHQVPAEDRVKDFLTLTIAQHQRVAPPGWEGVIVLPSK